MPYWCGISDGYGAKMPFGDHTKVYRLALPPGEMPEPHKPIPARLMKDIPAVEPPPWWHEYLMEEWKRKNHLIARRESRTKWQQDKDRWEHEDLMARAPQFLQGARGIPRHRVWEDGSS